MFDRQRQSARRTLDKRLQPFRIGRITLPTKQGWIRQIRYALGLTGTELAKRLGVTRQRLSKLEEAERTGAATLNSMKQAAAAMDCQFVYAFIPHTSLEEIVEARAREIAKRELKRVDQTMALEGQQVSTSEFDRRVTEYVRDHISETDLWRDD